MALAAHPSVVYFKATSGSASSGDEADGINAFNIKINGELLDTTDFKDTSGWHSFIQGLKGADVSFDGQVEAGDAPQSLLRSSLLTYADLWCTLHRNPTGGSGAKGFKAQVVIESYEEKGSVDGIAEFSCSMKVTGAVSAE